MKKTLLTLLGLAAVSLAGVNAEEIKLAGWTFNGTNAIISNPMPATNTATNLTVGGLSLGGNLTSGSAANSFGGSNFVLNGTKETALTNNNFISFTLTSAEGYTASLSSISNYNIRRSGTGPNTGIWQYQIGSGSWLDIGSDITWGGTTTAAGNAQGSIDLTGFPNLQNVDSSIGIRVLAWGATNTGGTFYLNAFQAGDDFVVNGTIDVIPEPSTWALIGLGSAFVLWRIRRKVATRA